MLKCIGPKLNMVSALMIWIMPFSLSEMKIYTTITILEYSDISSIPPDRSSPTAVSVRFLMAFVFHALAWPVALPAASAWQRL